MKPIQIAVFALFAVVAGATPSGAVADLPAYVERSECAAEARGLGAVEIRNPSGTVSVRGSSDGRIHVRATKTCRSGDPAAARRMLAGTDVQAGPVGGRYVVRVTYPKRIEAQMDFWDLFSERGRRHLSLPVLAVEVVVDVPTRLPVQVVTTSGDATAENLGGPLDVHTTSGDLVLRALRGPVMVASTSGDVELADVQRASVRTTSGDLKVAGVGTPDFVTASGDAEIEGARDSLRLESQSGNLVVADAPAGVRAETASGDVTVRGACGHVRLHSASGDIEARLRGPLGEADLATSSGEINLLVVPGMSAEFDASTTSGSIDCRLPVTVVRHDENSLAARLGRGGAHIRLRTASGNVNITSGGR